MKQRLLIIVVGIVLGVAARYAMSALSSASSPEVEVQAGEKMP